MLKYLDLVNKIPVTINATYIRLNWRLTLTVSSKYCKKLSKANSTG